MKVRRAYGMILFSVAVCLCLPAHSQPVLNYQGRVSVEGSPHNGPGWFKFALLDGGGYFVWASDGSSGPGEPGPAIQLPVDNGLFSADLGNVSIPGMNPIPPLALHAPHLTLRVWFSHNGSSFERLEPDTPVRPMDFSHFNTGRMIVVDMGGRGDYGSLQDAINRVADDGDYDAILVMPGHYEESIMIPDFKQRITIRGAANASAVQLWSSGATLTYGQGTEVVLENLSIFGEPALFGGEGMMVPYDEPAPSAPGRIVLRQCELAVWHDKSGPVIDLSGENELLLFDSEVENQGIGPALQISGNASVEASRTTFRAQTGDAFSMPWGGMPHLRMDQCMLHSDDGVSLFVQGTGGWGSFNNCHLPSGITLNQSHTSLDFNRCDIPGTLLVENGAGGHLNFQGCNFGHHQGIHAVKLLGGHPNAHFRNCRFHSSDATTFLLQDAPGWVTIEGSSLHANNASAIEMIATDGISLWEDQDHWDITLRSSVVSVHGDLETMPPAIRLDNGYSEDLELEIELISSDIMGRRDGIELGSGCMVFAHYSMIEGDRYGVYAPDGDAEVELLKCQVWGAQDLPGAGILINGSGFLFLQGSEITGEGEGSGLVLNFTEYGVAFLMQSTIGGMGGNALAVNGGIVHANQSTFFSLADSTLVLGGADATHRFNHCTFKSVADLFDEEELDEFDLDKPTVLIAGTQGQTPVPTFFACSFEPAGDADFSIELETATSGNIVLINSVLGKALGAGINNTAPAALDAHGNYILP